MSGEIEGWVNPMAGLTTSDPRPGNEQRESVRLGTGDGIRPDQGRTAGAVLNYHRLTQVLAGKFSEHACDEIVGAAAA